VPQREKKTFCPRYEGIKKVLAEGSAVPPGKRATAQALLPTFLAGEKYGAFLRNAVADAYFPLYKEIKPMVFCQNRHKLFYADYLVMAKE